ncbi:unnamed protein product [Trichogramma brassicae]|uniref:Uncharacterized protein n=1 Tax=Trichogramma brassicae TaxID=86971 RepID=A0A6H5J5I8_9HYME|nr:unnamed protein product [Trichogramma brassicae]
MDATNDSLLESIKSHLMEELVQSDAESKRRHGYSMLLAQELVDFKNWAEDVADKANEGPIDEFDACEMKLRLHHANKVWNVFNKSKSNLLLRGGNDSVELASSTIKLASDGFFRGAAILDKYTKNSGDSSGLGRDQEDRENRCTEPQRKKRHTTLATASK